ncbi:10241_t:CDS:2 [Acaulospora colombiana]|uniref:10241_t:CDS:1 n=1 Tax=Acaulospora colombiana TaxID=27376 RepID=A0ACA9PKC0_9GLOM|nr:10241_t:CDS:2 [Acaulospora colombiana]
MQNQGAQPKGDMNQIPPATLAFLRNGSPSYRSNRSRLHKPGTAQGRLRSERFSLLFLPAVIELWPGSLPAIVSQGLLPGYAEVDTLKLE